MTTPTQTLRRPYSLKPVRVRTQILQLKPATTTATRREETVADHKAREIRARRDLAVAIARAEETYSFAARRLEEFDVYLRSVRARLRAAGYLSFAGLGSDERGLGAGADPNAMALTSGAGPPLRAYDERELGPSRSFGHARLNGQRTSGGVARALSLCAGWSPQSSAARLRERRSSRLSTSARPHCSGGSRPWPTRRRHWFG
jgi:hypothetical protein